MPTRSSLLDTVMIHPIIKEKSNLIRPDILGNGAINITIRSRWKPEIMKMLEKKGITHEYLFSPTNNERVTIDAYNGLFPTASTGKP